MHSHYKRSVIHHSDDDSPKEDRNRQRRGHSKSIETSSKRCKISEKLNSGDNRGFSDDDREKQGGDRFSKSRRSWKHSSNNTKTEKAYTIQGTDIDGDNTNYGDTRRTRRKWRSNQTQTIELQDRWDPEGTEIVG